MEQELKNLNKSVLLQIRKLGDNKSLTDLYLRVFGANGEFNKLIKNLKNLPDDKKPILGKLANSVKTALEEEFYRQKNLITSRKLDEWIDVTLPGIAPKVGHLHIVTQAISEITQIFEAIGFTRVRYPEIDWEWYAFESLNMPKDHPARDDIETFFIDKPTNSKLGRLVLSPHTSSGQVREMERVRKTLPVGRQAPIRMINIAKCYRPNWDISHTPMFHQFEGLVIDRGINITHLKGTFDYFAKQFFGPKRKIRLRPFHFQFTEPSFEVDITCDVCNGTGVLATPRNALQEKCRLCKEGWLELGGAGMVHPNVLTAGKIDANKYSGYAFGWGIERTYMMKEGLKIDDLRLLYGNDVRFLEQF